MDSQSISKFMSEIVICTNYDLTIIAVAGGIVGMLLGSYLQHTCEAADRRGVHRNIVDAQ